MWKFGCLLAPVVLAGAWYFWPKAPGATETSRAPEKSAPKIVQTVETPPPLSLPPDLPSLPLPPAIADVKAPTGELPPPLIQTGSTGLPDLPVLPSLPPGPQTEPVQTPVLTLPPLPPLPGTKE